MFLTVIAVTMLLSGCSFGTIEEQKTGDVIYEIVKKEEIPEQLKEEIKEEVLPNTGRNDFLLYILLFSISSSILIYEKNIS